MTRENLESLRVSAVLVAPIWSTSLGVEFAKLKTENGPLSALEDLVVS
jgi:hypothetical protein